MTISPVDLPAVFPTQPELAVVSLFALLVDANLTGNIKLSRAIVHRLAHLGWRVIPAKQTREEAAI
jgi:hypothetical protein